MTFFLTSVFIFLVMWRPQDWLVPWLFGWPLLDIIFVLSLGTFIVEEDAGKIRIPKNVPQFWLLGGLIFAAAMSHVANTYLVGMLEAIPAVSKICVFTALLICVIDRVERIRAVVLIIVVMCCFMAWHALLQQYRGYGFADLAPMRDLTKVKEGLGSPWRSYFFGIFGDPNDLAQMLATSIPLVFMIPKRMNVLSFVTCCAVSYLLVLGVLSTQSRGGQVALAAGCAIMLVLLLPRRWLPYGMAIGVIGGLLLCPLAGMVLDESAHERVVFWGHANYVFKTKPLFGIGYDMFWQVAKSRAAHNAFVGCYTELGMFGYTFWFGLLYLGFVGVWRTRVHLGGARGLRERWLKRSIGMLIASTTAFAASSYFLSRTFLYPFFFLFALMAAVPVAAREFFPDGQEDRMFTKKDVRVVMPIVAVASVVYIYMSILFLNKAFYG